MSQAMLARGRNTGGEDPAIARSLVVWAIVLFGLTALAVLSFTLAGVDPRDAPPTFVIVVVLIGYTPSLAALLSAGFFPGAGGVRALLRQMGRWRVGIGWYVLVLTGPAALVLLANVIYVVLGGVPPPQWVLVPSAAELAVFVGPLIAGSLGEELGWRGFAQPRLQKRYGALWASVVVGSLWGTWHLWPVLAPGGLAHLTPADVVQTYARLIATSVLYAWLYNSTRGSLLLVMVAHAGHNIALDLVQLPPGGTDEVSVIIALLYLLVALVVIWATGPRTLSRSAAVEREFGMTQAAGSAVTAPVDARPRT
jgi:membrane protease YdiL (CAAX protease family)